MNKIYTEMSITQEEIKKIAEKLSKIPWDNEKLIWDLKEILKYVDLLWEVDTTWVKPTVSVVKKWMEFREDIVEEKNITTKELLNCSEQKVVGSQIVIPNIMK